MIRIIFKNEVGHIQLLELVLPFLAFMNVYQIINS